MHSGISVKPTTNSVSLCNNARLMSKVSKEIASENAENCRSRQPHCHSTPTPKGTPRISALTLHCKKVESLGYICAAIVWVYLHSTFRGWLQKTHVLCNWVRNGRSGSSKVVDFGTNQKNICDFLLVINSNFGPILHRFWDTATYWLKIANFSYPTLILHRRSESNFRISGCTFITKTKSPWAIRWIRFRDLSLRRFDTVPACDRRRHRRTTWPWLIQGSA